jgi:nucleoside-diphosphate-sugar epimerase
MSHVLFLGGTRFIGAAAVRTLVADGHTVTVFHRGTTEAALPDGVRHIHGDRAELGKHTNELRAVAPDVVVDMRALKAADTAAVQDVFRGHAKRHVLISSVDVYQAWDALRRRDERPIVESADGTFDEDAPLRRKPFPYREGHKEGDIYWDYDKIPCERRALDDRELPATVLRLPMVYGPDDYQHRLYAMARRMADGRPFVILSRPEAGAVLPRCFVDDVGRAIALAATDDRAEGRTYNVVDDPSLPERDWVALVGRVLGWEGRVIELDADAMPAHLKDDEPTDWTVSIAASARRIRSELGWTVRSVHEEAIARTVEWELAHPPEKLPPRDDDAEDRAIAQAVL